MNFYDVIDKRSSEKSFKSEPICEKKLSRIIDATLKSPSWKNKSSYKIVLVDEEHKKTQIAKAVVGNYKNEESIKEAPMVAVVVGNPSISGKIGDKEYYLVDGAIAMEHLILAATNEGYGTCWIAAIDEHMIKETLNIPVEYKVIGITPIGEVSSHEPRQSSSDASENVYSNGWQKPFDKQILH